MQKAQEQLEKLMQLDSIAELRQAVTPLTLTLPQAQQVISHAKSLKAGTSPLRLAIVHTYTSDLLNPWLELESVLSGLDLQTYHAPYGITLQEASEGSPLVAHEPDITLLLLREEDLHPQLTRPIAQLARQEQDKLREETLGHLRTILDAFRAHRVGQIVVTILPPVFSPGLGVFDAQSDRSESLWRMRFKSDVADYLRGSVRASLFLDLDQVVMDIGQRNFFDHRLWYSARFPFTPQAAREIARRVLAVGAVLKLPKAKVIVLDADNTLWGGIIGEDGIHGIALGPDYPGNAYLAFQRRLLDYQQRGFILALCSKNNPEDVKQVFQEHPHQLLRDEHFAAQRVNWLPKADNLLSLAEELNLGLESFVFVDDSDHECAAVRRRIPQIEVIQTPSKPILIPTCLDRVARLEILALTAEDRAKTELYAQERRRRELVQEGGDYLASLKMKMKVGFDDLTHLTRLSQLTQKTNQFNLTTRRYDEQQMREFVLASDWLVAHFSLADIFGDSGIVGLAVVKLLHPNRADLDTFLMSCRVIGREAEAAFLHTVLRRLQELGVVEVKASYIATAKNALVARFLPDQGFHDIGNGRYQRDLLKQPPKQEREFPIAVLLDSPRS